MCAKKVRPKHRFEVRTRERVLALLKYAVILGLGGGARLSLDICIQFVGDPVFGKTQRMMAMSRGREQPSNGDVVEVEDDCREAAQRTWKKPRTRTEPPRTQTWVPACFSQRGKSTPPSPIYFILLGGLRFIQRSRRQFCRDGGVDGRRNDEHQQDNECEDGRTKDTDGGIANGNGYCGQGSRR